MTTMDSIIDRLDQLLDRVEGLLPPESPPIDWTAEAFRWRTVNGRGFLQAVRHPHRVALEALQNIDAHKETLVRNTRRFLEGKPANNVLLTGARGTGKSTLIKGVWNTFSNQGLKLVEVDKTDLPNLTDILVLLEERPEHFIVFCDDLSFEEGDASYKALKSALDGSIASPADNIVFYATSNRRHLLPQTMRDNLDVSYEEGELRPSDSIEEKTSLSDRFGLWLSFYPFSQNEYLAAARYWVEALGGQWSDEVEAEALLWHRTRGARSGRVAWQFARDHVDPA
ncbi:ATP-binding protein [Marinimicrobium sp. C6131]|uniref:ATP-binding protein n=1 Tax=Marinimicrobium sp. C6131 TaxID=3022676 RepID=UPI00223D8AF2|nr:ATP-binding protein [Marinimicrobium sp. C6131]UZJ45412.1 ATP-binding protein [Marinimicrobium sp. C6131]